MVKTADGRHMIIHMPFILFTESDIMAIRF
jgi:hypothetical protein